MHLLSSSFWNVHDLDIFWNINLDQNVEFTILMLTTKGLELNDDILVPITEWMYILETHFQASKFAEQLWKRMRACTGVWKNRVHVSQRISQIPAETAVVECALSQNVQFCLAM